MSKKVVLSLLVLGVFLLHQDFWNWRNGGLVLGFLPIGLAYHAAYAILSAAMMWVLVKFAWPKQLDELETKPAKDSTEDGK
jgi:surface polysaccharide O-acyltransferase-like enzyme